MMAMLKRNHTTITTTPCKKVRALVTSANAKCKIIKGQKVRTMVTSTSAKLKAIATIAGGKEKGNYDNNVVDKNPKL